MIAAAFVLLYGLPDCSGELGTGGWASGWAQPFGDRMDSPQPRARSPYCCD